MELARAHLPQSEIHFCYNVLVFHDAARLVNRMEFSSVRCFEEKMIILLLGTIYFEMSYR